MADALISDLSAAVALAGADLLETEQGVTPNNHSKKITLTQLLAFMQANLTFDPYAATPVTALTPAATLNINLNGGKNRKFTISLNATAITSITFSNLPAAGYVADIEVEIKQDATGGRAFPLPAAFKALGGSDTTVTTSSNTVTVLSAITFDQGTTWRYAMQESA